MDDHDRRLSEFERLNVLGKAAFLGGTAVKLLASGIDHALHRVADMVIDIEKSFQEGLDPNIEEAKILEERERPGKNTGTRKTN